MAARPAQAGRGPSGCSRACPGKAPDTDDPRTLSADKVRGSGLSAGKGRGRGLSADKGRGRGLSADKGRGRGLSADKDRIYDLLAQPGRRLPGRALFATVQIGNDLTIKSIHFNRLRRLKRLPGGEARLGNGPADRFRAERAEPQGAARRSAGRDRVAVNTPLCRGLSYAMAFQQEIRNSALNPPKRALSPRRSAPPCRCAMSAAMDRPSPTPDPRF